ncbi:pentatricopeptide repeat-containing protein [Tanacetum coccineum]
MKLLGVTSHSVAESAMVRWLAKKGRIEETLLVFNCMLRSKIVLTTATFTTLMHSFCKKLEFQEVLKLKHIMEINHVRFDVVTYNVLIRGFCDSNDLVGALKLYREMKERGVCPTVNTFCVIIESFCKKIDFPYGEMILDDLCRKVLLSEDEISQDMNGYLEYASVVYLHSVANRDDSRRCLEKVQVSSAKLRGQRLKHLNQLDVDGGS